MEILRLVQPGELLVETPDSFRAKPVLVPDTNQEVLGIVRLDLVKGAEFGPNNSAVGVIENGLALGTYQDLLNEGLNNLRIVFLGWPAGTKYRVSLVEPDHRLRSVVEPSYDSQERRGVYSTYDTTILWDGAEVQNVPLLGPNNPNFLSTLGFYFEETDEDRKIRELHNLAREAGKI